MLGLKHFSHVDSKLDTVLSETLRWRDELLGQQVVMQPATDISEEI